MRANVKAMGQNVHHAGILTADAVVRACVCMCMMGMTVLGGSAGVYAAEAQGHGQAVAGKGAPSLSPDTSDARKIMEVVESRPSGDKVMVRMQMTILDGAGNQRVRVVQSRMMHFPGGSKSLVLFESPADIRGTGLLSVDYDDGSKEDDQWLYLPSLHKATRIASGDKSGSFMGSDFSFADMTKMDASHYTYELLSKSVTVDGDECWVIESRPNTDKAKSETGYLKSQLWISKHKLMPLQIKAWVIKGKRIKYMKFEDVRLVDGIWTPHRLSAKTVSGGTAESTTVLTYSELQYNSPSVTENDFTQRRLEKGL